MSFSLYNRFRQLEKVRVDKDAFEGYLGATGSDGVLRVGSNLTYTDGGNYITLDIASSPTLAGLSLTGELDITMATSLLIDLNPGFTGTGNVINITPSAPLDVEDAEWDGINIDGTLLSPSVIGTFIHGVHVDFSGIDITNDPHIDGIHVQMPYFLNGSHAIHAEGEVHVNIDASTAVASMSYTAIDVVLDTVGATGGMLHAMDVARVTGGTLSTVAVGTHTGIDVIHQHIGTATRFDKVWEYNGGWTDVTDECDDENTDVVLWDAQNDIVYFGHSTTFDEIECTWATPATKDMHFTFWYSTGTSTYTEFDPADDTRGGQTNGLIRFLASDIGSWAVGTVNGTAGKYWIKIIRTRLAGTAPTEDTVKYIKGTTYEWDKLGAITANKLNIGSDTLSVNEVAGKVGIGTASPDNPLSFASVLGNKIDLYDRSGSDIYGFGIQSNLLQIIVPGIEARIGMGYGNSGSFTETLTVKGAKVGIGTASLQRPLHIEAAIPYIRLSDSDATTDQNVACGIEFYRGNDTNRVGYISMTSVQNDILVIATDYTDGEIRLRTGDAADRLTIDKDGNVDIGATLTVGAMSASNIIEGQVFS